jgi:hypothetical protein
LQPGYSSCWILPRKQYRLINDPPMLEPVEPRMPVIRRPIMIDSLAPINAGWERYRDTVLMPMDTDAIETARLAWFCAAVFLWELMEQSASHPGLATTISEELQVFKDHMMQNARPERTQ